MRYQFIAIEGNIGSGKTTLAHLLSKKLHGRLVLEAFADNPFLPAFYDNPGQHAFPLELFFLAERYKQLKEMVHTADLFRRVSISDYLFAKCLVFARVNLPDEEFRLFQRLYEIVRQPLVQPDMLIYLHMPVEQLQRNIRKRNRSYEQRIQDDYLLRLQETYTQYIRQHGLRTLFVDATHADFLGNERHMEALLGALDQELEPGIHPVALP